MRDYGAVRVRFWAWAKDKELSPAARELALYCLTCPHANSLGFYRLPIAYIADDLGTVPDTVRETVSELSRIGFLRHDEKSGWCWIVGYLDHNPIANGNVGKSLVGFIQSIPRNLAFYQEFIEVLQSQAKRFPAGLIDGLANGLANRCTNGMPNHDHDHDHDHDHEKSAVPAPPCGGSDQSGDGGSSPERQAYELWNEFAARIPIWPRARELTEPRRQSLRARLRELNGLAGFRGLLEKAEASKFIRDEGMNGWGLDWLLKPANLQKVLDGNYDDDRRRSARAGPSSRVETMMEVVQELEQREQQYAD